MAAARRGAGPHIPTRRKKHVQPPPPLGGPIPKGASRKRRLARKLCCGKGREIHPWPNKNGESLFGLTKEGRALSLFLLRELER
jgi:hypothetical protein